MSRKRPDITTVSINPEVAGELRKFFNKCGGRGTFRSMSNFLRVLLTIASFYPPERIVQVNLALSMMNDKSTSPESIKMLKQYLAFIEQQGVSEEKEPAVVYGGDIVRSVVQKMEENAVETRSQSTEDIAELPDIEADIESDIEDEEEGVFFSDEI